MNQKGLTLMEVLVAVTLLSLLSVAMFMAMRIGLNSYVKADARLMDNRRAVGAQRIVEEEIEGFVPVLAVCNGGNTGPGTKIAFFQGEPEVMRLVSTFSLQGGWRGQPQVLEMFVIPEKTGGVCAWWSTRPCIPVRPERGGSVWEPAGSCRWSRARNRSCWPISWSTAALRT
jgi:prepilin-type N-terminal cleavage/methylation domain-containing protein